MGSFKQKTKYFINGFTSPKNSSHDYLILIQPNNLQLANLKCLIWDEESCCEFVISIDRSFGQKKLQSLHFMQAPVSRTTESFARFDASSSRYPASQSRPMEFGSSRAMDFISTNDRNTSDRSSFAGTGERTVAGTLRQAPSSEQGNQQGFVYSGQIEKGQMHGRGTLTYPTGEKYEGEWEMGKRYGMGRMTFPDGSRYVGEWVHSNFRHSRIVFLCGNRGSRRLTTKFTERVNTFTRTETDTTATG